MENRPAVGAAGLSVTAIFIAIVSMVGGGGSAPGGAPVVLDGGASPAGTQPGIVLAADSTGQGIVAGFRLEVAGRPAAASRVATGRQLLADFLGDSALAAPLPRDTSGARANPAARARGDSPRADTLAADTVVTEERRCARAGGPCYRLGVLVATLPDPLDSGMDWAFDASWEAVRRGFERAGFVMDRFWLPWMPGGDSSAAASARTRVPGVVLFRSRNPRDSLLRLLYLVGEVPTAGVYKQALAAALTEADALLGGTPALVPDSSRRSRLFGPPCAPHCGRELPLIGPTFSGSTVSLRLALRAHHATSWDRYRIISGAASNGLNVCRLSWNDAGVTPAEYSATVHVDGVLQRFSNEVLAHRLGIPPARTAILREGTTQYGQLSRPSDDSTRSARVSASAAQALAGLARRDTAPAARSPAETLAGASTTATPIPTAAADTANWRCLDAIRRSTTREARESRDAEGGAPLEIPFPINISRLRSAIVNPNASGAEMPAFGRQQPMLPLDLRETRRTVTNPPVFSELTPPALAGAVNEIAQTLAAHRVQAVGIVASDVRDVVFLASEVRKRFRDVVLYTYSSNTLYGHPQYNVELRGMLMLSTYPLTLEAQYWQKGVGDRQRVVFTTNLAQGIHNATLRQLGEDSAEVGTHYARGDTARISEYPPVWVTVVGRGGIFPVSLMPVPSGSDSARRARGPFGADDDGPHPAIEWPIFFLLVGLTVLGWRAWRRVRREEASLRCQDSRELPARWPTRLGVVLWSAMQWKQADRAVIVDPDHRWTLAWLRLQEAMFSLAMVGAVAVALTLGSVVVYQWARDGLYALFLGIAAMSALCALLLAAIAAASGIRAARGSGLWNEHFHVEVVARWSAGLLLAGLAIVTVVLLIGTAARDMLVVNRQVFMWRLAAIGSGVSPAVPLLVGALLVLAWGAWQRHRVRRLYEVPNFERYCESVWRAVEHPTARRLVPWFAVPAGDGPELLPAGRLGAAMARVRAGLFFALPNPPMLLLAIVTVVVGLWTFRQFTRTIESVVFAPGEHASWLATAYHRVFAFDVVFHTLIVGALAATLFGLLRFLYVWLSFRRCLTELAMTPLLRAFRRLPAPVARLTRLSPWSAPGEAIIDSALELRWRQWIRDLDKLATRAEESAASVVQAEADAEMERARLAAQAAAQAQRTAAIPGCATTTSAVRKVPRLSLKLDGDVSATDDSRLLALARRVDAEWRRKEHLAFGDPDAEETVTAATPEPPSAEQFELRRAEECLAIFAVEYIEWVLNHLRALAGLVLAAAVLTTVLMASYPFQPQSTAKLVGLLLLMGAPAALLFVLYQMNRDEVLSSITRTDARRISWDGPFIMNIVVFVLVPLLTLLSTEVPEVREFLFSWLTPLLRSAGRM